LRERFPRAMRIGIDASLPSLRRAARRGAWWKRALGLAPAIACADAEHLPLAAGCVQLALSNLMLPWCDPARVFAQVARALEVGGLFLFSTCGPDTLKELRAAFDDGGAHVHAFVDMHDLGDALVAAGFADPVMEMEAITLEYSSVEALARELKGCGANNALRNRPRGLGGRAHWAAMAASYERLRRDGALPATFEIVYGHAWKAAPRTIGDGRQVIAFRDRTR
jgi:malonyl-CoA O-methyltransferase